MFPALKNELLNQKYYKSENDLIEQIFPRMKKIKLNTKILILGGEGRCGRGVASLLKKLNVGHTSLGRGDVKNIQQIRSEILKSNIVFNCTSLDRETPIFLSKEDLNKKRNLSLIIDVACDIEKQNNSFPIYDKKSSLDSPAINISRDTFPLWMISIDNLASLIPIESSEQFSYCMLPYYIDLLNGVNNHFINYAISVFEKILSKSA